MGHVVLSGDRDETVAATVMLQRLTSVYLHDVGENSAGCGGAPQAEIPPHPCWLVSFVHLLSTLASTTCASSNQPLTRRIHRIGDSPQPFLIQSISNDNDLDT